MLGLFNLGSGMDHLAPARSRSGLGLGNGLQRSAGEQSKSGLVGCTRPAHGLRNAKYCWLGVFGVFRLRAKINTLDIVARVRAGLVGYAPRTQQSSCRICRVEAGSLMEIVWDCVAHVRMAVVFFNDASGDALMAIGEKSPIHSSSLTMALGSNARSGNRNLNERAKCAAT
jgi:hypothetical protein